MVKDTKALIYATIIMMIIFITAASMLSITNSYNPSVLGNATGTFHSLNSSMWAMAHSLNDTNNKLVISNVTVSEGIWGVIDFSFKSAIGIMKVTGTSLLFLVTFFSNIGTYLGLPNPFNYICNLVGVLINITLFFAFIKLITKAE
jgi:hypothetical protein